MKSKIHWLFIAFTIVIAPSCSEDSPISNNQLNLSEKFQKVLDDGIVKYGGKGISAAVIMPNGYTWKGASGISHGSIYANTNMLFSAGSITKTFTAATIMLLAEEEKLSIDDSLHNWLPSFNNIDSTVTLRQLLNHTSGIFDLSENTDLWNEILIS